jgi:hypothetical protein
MNSTSNTRPHWLTSSFFFTLAFATLFFALANPGSKIAASPTPSSPTYTTGNFTFSSPMKLAGNPGPLSAADAEPEIKVDIFDNIYITAIEGVGGGTDFWKSTNKGASFVFMGQPDGAQDHCVSLPLCIGAAGGGDDSIAVSNGGYLYVSSLWLGSVTMSASYDGGTGGAAPGQAWAVNPGAASIPGDDRQWIASYGPQTVYMSYTDIPTGVVDFQKSTDGGKTFSAPVQTYPATSSVLSDVQGPMVVDQYNGNIYITFVALNADNQIYIERSTDGGSTWTLIQAYNGPAGTTNAQVFPTTAVDRGGNIYVAFSSCGSGHSNCQIQMVSSTDQGSTWSSALRVSNGSQTATSVEPTIAAGGPGIVNVTWLGTTASSPDVSSDWHVFFAQVTNALTTSPTIAQNQVETNVMHKWDICFNGLGCANNVHQSPGNRDLLEYYSMAIDNDGNANIIYTDSVTDCPDATCITNVWFTKQTFGPGAYNPPAAPAPATFAANFFMPASSNDAEPNMKADSHNCLFSAAPGAPDTWKSTNAGGSFFKLPNAVTSAGGVAGGGDEDILPVPQPSGARPDYLYYADLAVASVNISKSTDGGATWFSPGPMGAAGEVSVSTDRQWMAYDRNGADTTVYLWEHEFVSQILRMNALTDDMVWSPFASGMSDPELIAPPGSTLENTVPGPVFVDPATHKVYGFLSASTVTTNVVGAPTGKLPNVWEADGAGTFTAGVPPGPFTNHPVFKGVIDSPTNPAPPAGSATVGSNTANLFNGATIDRAGNIYATWATPNGRSGLYDVWFASSRDHGQTFYGPFKINPNSVQGNMPWIAAGDNGRVEIVYYGTNGTQDPTTSTTDQWNVFFAQSLNATDREPAFTVSQASDHIMHVGPICNVGILCGSGTRQLLDFFQVAIGPDGLANIAYADTGSGNGTSHISYARQTSGPLGLTNPSAVTCLPPPPLTAVVSRKTHGTITPPFDLTLNLVPTTPATIEPRAGGSPSGNHTLVFRFANALTGVTSVTATARTSSGTQNVTVNGAGTGIGVDTGTGSHLNEYTVSLTGVPNASHVTVTLNGVTDVSNNGPSPISVRMDVLWADVNQTGGVDGNDVSAVQAHTRQTANSGNYLDDVNITGGIDGNDVSRAQSQTRTALPP